MLHEEDEDRPTSDRDAVEPAPTPAEPDGVWEEAESEVPVPGLLGSSWRAGTFGFRWASYIVGPIAAMVLLPGLVLFAFGLGTGHGFGLPDLVTYAFASYSVAAGLGGIVGAAVGFLNALIGRLVAGRSAPSWWVSANRPIRLSGPREHGARPAEAGAESSVLGLLASMRRGGRTGFRNTSYIAGPFAGVWFLVMITLFELGVLRDRELSLLVLFLGTITFYVGCALVGAVIGAVIGLIGSLLGRMRPRRPGPPRGEPDRSRRSSRRKSGSSTVAETARLGFIRRLWPLLIGVPVQTVLLTAFGAGAYLARDVGRRLAEAKATADDDDPYWQLEDLMAHRDPVPYGENSAIVVAEALELLPASWPKDPAPPAGMRRPPSSGVSEAYDRLNDTGDNIRPDEDTVDAIRDQLERYREAVQIARTLMYYDRGRNEVEIAPTVIDTLLPQTQACRAVTRLLAADSAIRALDGDLDGALDSCRAILGVGRSIGDEPFLISQLVRYATGVAAMKSARRVLGQGEPGDAALGRLQALILDELDRPLLFWGVRGERALMVEMIRRIRDGEIPLTALSNEHGKAETGGTRTTLAPWQKLMYDNQMAMALEWLNDAVVISQRPVAEQPALWKEWDARIHRTVAVWHYRFTSAFVVLMMPAIASGSSPSIRHQAELGATAILLAAERHRRRSGAWPATIEDIDEKILPHPPLDPSSGQPFRMEHRDGRLFIYSVGPNLVDEHGAFDQKKGKTGRFDDVGAIGWDVDLRRLPATDGDEHEESP